MKKPFLKKRPILLMVGSLVLIGVCTVFFTACKPIIRGFKEVRFVQFKDSIINIEADAIIYNGNIVGGRLKSVDAEVIILDKKLGTCATREPAYIKARDTTVVTIIFKSDIRDFADIFNQMASMQNVKIQVNGKYKISILGMGKEIIAQSIKDVNAKDELQKYINQALSKHSVDSNRVQLNNVNLGLGKTQFKLDIPFKNPTPIECKIKKTELDLYSKDAKRPFGHYSLPEEKIAKARETAHLSGDVALNNFNALLQLPKLLKGKREIRMAGDIVVEAGGQEFRLPLDITIALRPNEGN